MFPRRTLSSSRAVNAQGTQASVVSRVNACSRERGGGGGGESETNSAAPHLRHPDGGGGDGNRRWGKGGDGSGGAGGEETRCVGGLGRGRDELAVAAYAVSSASSWQMREIQNPRHLRLRIKSAYHAHTPAHTPTPQCSQPPLPNSAAQGGARVVRSDRLVRPQVRDRLVSPHSACPAFPYSRGGGEKGGVKGGVVGGGDDTFGNDSLDQRVEYRPRGLGGRQEGGEGGEPRDNPSIKVVLPWAPPGDSLLGGVAAKSTVVDNHQGGVEVGQGGVVRQANPAPPNPKKTKNKMVLPGGDGDALDSGCGPRGRGWGRGGGGGGGRRFVRSTISAGGGEELNTINQEEEVTPPRFLSFSLVCVCVHAREYVNIYIYIYSTWIQPCWERVRTRRRRRRRPFRAPMIHMRPSRLGEG